MIGKLQKARLWSREMMDYADAVNQIERLPERQVQDVCLYNVHVRQLPCVSKGHLHRIRQIDTDNSASRELSSQKHVTPFSTPGIQYDSVFEVRWSEGCDPRQEFLRVRAGQSRIMGPFIAKCVRRGFLLFVKSLPKEAWNAADNREPGSAAVTNQNTFNNL